MYKLLLFLACVACINAYTHLEWINDDTIHINSDADRIELNRVQFVDDCFSLAVTNDMERVLINMCPVEHKNELACIDPELAQLHKYLPSQQIRQHEKQAQFPYQVTIRKVDGWYTLRPDPFEECGQTRRHTMTKDLTPQKNISPELNPYVAPEETTNQEESSYFDDAETHASRTLNSYVNNQRVVELAILNDYHRHIHLGNDTETTQIDTRAIVLLADMLYADGGFDPHVRIQLSESIITDNTPGYMNLVAADGVSFTTTTTTCGATSNEIGITENSTCAVGDCASGEICAEDYLNEAQTWRGGPVFTGGAPDVVQVLSGLDFSGGTQGLARLGSACDQFNGIGNVIRAFACVCFLFQCVFCAPEN